MALEDPTNAALSMDRGVPLGNSPDASGRRRLHVLIANLLSEPIPVDITDASVTVTQNVPNTGFVSNVVAVSNAVAVKLTPSPLANRKFMIIFNPGARLVFGPSGVTGSTGIDWFNNEKLSFAIGPDIDLWAIKPAAGSVNVIVQEYS